MIELIFEFVASFFFEFFGQLVIELIAELGLRGILSATGLGKYKHPLLSVIGYAVLGSIGGGLSLLVYKEHFIKNQGLRFINIVLTPVVVGSIMALRGKILKRKGKLALKLDTFGYGFLFAFTFAIVRQIYAK